MRKTTKKLTAIEEDRLLFSDGTVIRCHHDQDCCENVYADFKQLEDTNIKDQLFPNFKIEGIQNSGFRLNGYFIPCYSKQNGYYSDNLALIVDKPDGVSQKIDITPFVLQDYD